MRRKQQTLWLLFPAFVEAHKVSGVNNGKFCYNIKRLNWRKKTRENDKSNGAESHILSDRQRYDSLIACGSGVPPVFAQYFQHQFCGQDISGRRE